MTTVARTVVFLGPTLLLHKASALFSADYRPPAEQGSIYECVRRSAPARIVLVDGSFGRVPAVRHKEILYALSRGVAVHGVASMGALRAAELAAYGMQGHGLVYRWYRATPLADDDEVAVAMMPSELGASPLSEALIDMRVTLRHAQARRILSATIRRRLVEIARTIHFSERSYPLLFERARQRLPAAAGAEIARVEKLVETFRVLQKAADAAALLAALARRDVSGAADPPRSPTFAFELTDSWLVDLAAAGFEVGDLV